MAGVALSNDGRLYQHLKLHHKGEVVGRDVGVGAADDLVLSEPLLVVWSQLTKYLQPTLRVEDVVDNALEIVPAHRETHQL